MISAVSWVRAARTRRDELIAGAFTVLWLAGVVGGRVPDGRGDLVVFAVCGVLITVPLAWRRRAPVAVVLVVSSAALALAYSRSADLPIGMVIASLVAGYSLGAYARGRRSAAALIVALVLVAVANVRHNDAGVAGLILTPVVFLVVPWLVGRLVSRLLSERAALRRLSVQLEHEQREVARTSVLEERSRIARELHDIVAHSISVMVVQAGAAEQFIDPSSRARTALADIRTTGQQALVEMRHLLGILRTDDPDGSTLAPAPGLAGLEALAAAARQSGLGVTVAERGERPVLPPGVDVAAYRLVQESLSNIRKHARARTAAVTLDYRSTRLTIDVIDDGVGGVGGSGPVGHGLIGMRERVALYGGRLESGPRAEGGWRVTAELPVRP
ncbi:sensor histidine kinase [uncultured Jatrophihabitans sp.]|uniref:sensor histidine kinase n=1 Tax=uncultured Jatrophihabitans sp. TaxID=1610747 RepID=UPI0035C99378